MVYKPRRERRAKGGKAETEPLHPEHGHLYNAEGSPAAKSAEDDESDGFRRGGMPKRKKRKEGGKVEGHAARHHLGKRARGGATAPHVEMHLGEHHEKHGEHHKEEHRHHEEEREKRARGGHVRSKHARGGAPFSEAHHISPPGNDKKGGPGEDAETIP